MVLSPQPSAPPVIQSAPRSSRGVDVGGVVCASGRAGFWSGYKAGGCLGIGIRGTGVGFDFEAHVLGGGTITTLDVLFQPSMSFSLVGESERALGLYTRIGATFVGISSPTSLERGGTYVRMGGLAGIGYELEVGDHVNWRLFDVGFFADGQLRPHGERTVFMSRLDQGFDLGFQVSTGFFFH